MIQDFIPKTDTVIKTKDIIVHIDASLKEDHILESVLTEFPVEKGSILSDHRVKKPKSLRMVGLISDNPLGLIKFDGNMEHLNPLFSRSKDAWHKLNDIYEKTELIEVITGLDVYKNMIFISLVANRTEETAGSLEFTATLKEINIIKSEDITLNIKVRSIDEVNPREKINIGKQQKKAVNNESAFFKLFFKK